MATADGTDTGVSGQAVPGGTSAAAGPEDAAYDLVYVRARPWSDERPRTASLVQLDFEFLGESLPIAAARERRQTLDHHGVSVLIVPRRYRHPAVDPARAASLAEEEMAAAWAANPAHELGAPRLYGDHPMYFTFLAVSAPMERAGDTFPPGLLVTIDKFDGHVWTATELSDFLALVATRQSAG